MKASKEGSYSDYQQFDSASSSSKYQTSKEQFEMWFLGSLMSINTDQPDFNRISTLHNRITQECTKFDERFQANIRVASQLAEFFPFKWLLEISSTFRKMDSSGLGIKSIKSRVSSYLGFIELYLTFRGLTILDSTLDEINDFFALDITKNEVRTWKLKLLRIIPELRAQWVKIRAQTHQSAIFSSVVQVMNKEMVLNESYSKEDAFLVKQTCLKLAQEFTVTTKARHIKKPEIWARAICVKAVREILPDFSTFPIPNLSIKNQKVIENKKWQLDKIL
ncbi:MAG: hypothetical protein ACFE98_05355 [Candidatus Hermodarchaeota archaeon]